MHYYGRSIVMVRLGKKFVDRTHIVEDIDDNEDRHPSVELPHESLLHLFSSLDSAKLCVWVIVKAAVHIIVGDDVLRKL